MATAAVQATSPAWKPQNDGSTAILPPVNWRELLSFLSPTGQQRIVGSIQRTLAEHGAVLTTTVSEFPEFGWLIELLCDRDIDDVFKFLQKEYPTLPLSLIKPQLENLHATIRFEIEKRKD